MALKIDITKAFDTLSSPFIKTFDCFGFNSKLCMWIHVILQFSFLSIGMNDNQVGFFKCSNGLRQIDPLYLILFCLVEEVLSSGILKLVVENHISLIKESRNCNMPSHALYADEIMIFC